MKDELRALKSLAGPFPPFDPDAAPDDPRTLFASWLRAAIDAGIKEPHAMVLSTVDAQGAPDARILILKNLDHRGWHFATMDSGPKGRQIAGNPQVALTFYWPALGRQVRIRGVAARAEAEDCAADFLARPNGAKAVAMVARQSDPLESAQDLDAALTQQLRRLEEAPTGPCSSSGRMPSNSGRAMRTAVTAASVTSETRMAGRVSNCGHSASVALCNTGFLSRDTPVIRI